jgi:hypothetical protein
MQAHGEPQPHRGQQADEPADDPPAVAAPAEDREDLTSEPGRADNDAAAGDGQPSEDFEPI